MQKSDPLLKKIPGVATARNLNRKADIDDNIANVRQEFLGKPEVCHKMVGHIIHLRRDPQNWEHRQGFWDTWNAYKKTLLKEFDVRWLLSVCDTVVDIGNNVQSAVAMNIVQCINGTNVHHTICVNAVNGNLDTNKMNAEIKVPTWGGMQTADVPTGDMIYNMMCRLDGVIQLDPMLNEIWHEIKDRGRQEPNVIMNYFCGASRFKHQRKFFQ